MANTKDYSTREKILDKYLQSRRGYTRKELQYFVNKELARRGRDPVTARTTILNDMNEIENKYNTVISREQRGRSIYYFYQDSTFSIFNIDLTDEDYDKISMAVTALKRLQGIPKFSWVDELEARLDMTVRKKSRPILMFEDASYNTGMEYFLPLYEYIADRTTVRLIYQNFRSEESEERIVYPYLLKQYNNRWFLFGTDKGYTTLSIYPLDRILSVDSSEEKFIDTDIDFATYFSDKIGVGIPKEGNEVRDILFRVPLNQKPYLVTKPLHSSQTLVSEDAEWATFSLHVRVNYELQQELLAFGDLIEILAPADFRELIKSRLQKSLARYEK